MAEARSEFEWTLTANLLSMIANTARDPKKHRKPFSPDDFNPYSEKISDRVIEITKENVWMMRKAFTGKA